MVVDEDEFEEGAGSARLVCVKVELDLSKQEEEEEEGVKWLAPNSFVVILNSRATHQQHTLARLCLSVYLWAA